MLVVGLGPPLGPLRALPSPSQFPYLLFLFASKAGISLLGHQDHPILHENCSRYLASPGVS